MKSILCFIMLLTGFASTARAADGGGGYIGPLLGLTLPSQGGSSLTLGLKGAYKFLPLVRTALYYYHFGSSIESPTGDSTVLATSSTSLIGLEAAYPFSNTIAAGLKLGKMSNSLAVTATTAGTTVDFTAENSGFFVAPTFQYDVPIGKFSAGAEFNYILSLSSSVPNAMMLLGVGKFWF